MAEEDLSTSSTDFSWADISEEYDKGAELLEKFKYDRGAKNKWFAKTRICYNLKVVPKSPGKTSSFLCPKRDTSAGTCLYAHSYEELLPVKCVYGRGCPGLGCEWWHPGQDPVPFIEKNLDPKHLAGYRSYLKGLFRT